MGEAVVEGGTRLCFQHIPHLGLAVLVLVLQSVFIGGVHLNGQVLFGINELGKYGELTELSQWVPRQPGWALMYCWKVEPSGR